MYTSCDNEVFSLVRKNLTLFCDLNNKNRDERSPCCFFVELSPERKKRRRKKKNNIWMLVKLSYCMLVLLFNSMDGHQPDLNDQHSRASCNVLHMSHKHTAFLERKKITRYFYLVIILLLIISCCEENVGEEEEIHTYNHPLPPSEFFTPSIHRHTTINNIYFPSLKKYATKFRKINFKHWCSKKNIFILFHILYYNNF